MKLRPIAAWSADAAAPVGFPALIAMAVLWTALQAPGAGHYSLGLALCSLPAGLLLLAGLRRTPGFSRPGGLIATVALCALVLLVRLLPLRHTSDDYILFLHPWYVYLQAHGLAAYRAMFTDYTPFYSYLLGLPALVLRLPEPLIAIKLISFVGDGVAALFVYRIARLKYAAPDRRPVFAAIAFLLLPTVILNSAYLGQCDAWYTGWLLGCVYYFMRGKPLPAMACFAFALSLKLQAVFLSPFLLVLMLNRRLPWFYFAVIPAIYALLCVPAWLAGRGWADLLTIYLYQFSEDDKLTHHGATLYLLFSKHFVHTKTVKDTGILLAVTIMALFSWRNRRSLPNTLPAGTASETIMLLALTSVALTPFLLPKMHDRYFFPADVFSLVLAVLSPRWWPLAVAFQLISAFSIYKTIPGLDVVFGFHRYLILIAMAVNCVAAVKLWRASCASRRQNV